MCLATIAKRPTVAKKAITTYKFLEDGLMSPYSYFPYEIGKLYKTEMGNPYDEDTTYDDIATEGVREWTKKGKEVQYIATGFHSIRTMRRVKKCYEPEGKIYICTIPKGSMYYIDNTGLIVSDKIIIRRKHKG